MTQLTKYQTLDLSSVLDLRAMSSSPVLGSTLGVESTLQKKKKKINMVNVILCILAQLKRKKKNSQC